MFICQAQGLKYAKCNGPHKTEHYLQFAWYYKANFKINSPRLKTKQNKLYSYSFKCLNCKGDHQANFNIYLF